MRHRSSTASSREVRAHVCVCVARVNVYLPDDLAQRAKAAGLSISAVTQNALRSALTAGEPIAGSIVSSSCRRTRYRMTS
jgi:post-segregation antitoxin (ccd killing protein)